MLDDLSASLFIYFLSWSSSRLRPATHPFPSSDALLGQTVGPQSSQLRLTVQTHQATMWVELLLALGLVFLYLYRICTRQFDEFQKRGIPFAKPR